MLVKKSTKLPFSLPFACTLTVFFFSFTGCNQNPAFQGLNESQILAEPDGELASEILIDHILNESLSWEVRKSAVLKLQQNRDWENLAKALPPRGKFDVVSIKVLEAIVEIGDRDAIAMLKAVEDYEYEESVWINGQFWASLDWAIQKLDGTNK